MGGNGENAKKAAEQQAYANYLNALNQLNAIRAELRKPYYPAQGNADDGFIVGLPKPMTSEQLEALKQSLSQVYGKIKEYIAVEKPKSDPDLGQHNFSVNKELKNIKNEMTLISDLNPDDLPTYDTMLSRGSDVTIDMGESSLERMSGIVSQRIPIRYVDDNGRIRQGYFTKDVNVDKDAKSIFEESSILYPELQSLIDEMQANPKIVDKFKSTGWAIPKNTSNNMILNELVPGFKERLIEFGVSPAVVRNLNWSAESVRKFSTFACQFDRKDLKETYSIMGIGLNQNLNHRNSSMSDIAHLLGMDSIIAKSESMKIVENGKVYSGTFMEDSFGMSLGDASYEKSPLVGKNLKVQYDTLGKSSSDLMILDYICLNADRHIENIFYNIENVQGVPTFKSVQGIDNDMAFGTLVPKADEAVKTLPPLDTIKYISQSTAEKVMSLNEASIRTALQGRKLTDAEIDSCWKRTQMLQKHIQNPAKVSWVPDDQWTEDKFVKQSTLPENVKQLKHGFTINNPFACCGKIITRWALKVKDYLETRARAVTQALKDMCSGLSQSDKRKVMKNIESNRATLAKDYDTLKETEIRQKLNEKKLKQGARALGNKLMAGSKITVGGQKRELERIQKSLPKPDKKSTAEYTQLYQSVEALSHIYDEIEQEKSNPGEKHVLNARVYLDKSGQLTQMAQNLLSDQYSDIIKQSRSCLEKMPYPVPNKMASSYAAMENLNELCEVAKSAGERRIHEINELMASGVKQLLKAEEKRKTAEASGIESFEYKLADAEFKAQEYLASKIGNLELKESQRDPEVRKALATLTVAEQVTNLKKSSKGADKDFYWNIKCDPNSISTMAAELANNEKFKKSLAEMIPAKIFSEKTIQNLASEAPAITSLYNGNIIIGAPENQPELLLPNQ